MLLGRLVASQCRIPAPSDILGHAADCNCHRELGSSFHRMSLAFPVNAGTLNVWQVVANLKKLALEPRRPAASQRAEETAAIGPDSFPFPMRLWQSKAHTKNLPKQPTFRCCCCIRVASGPAANSAGSALAQKPENAPLPLPI